MRSTAPRGSAACKFAAGASRIEVDRRSRRSFAPAPTRSAIRTMQGSISEEIIESYARCTSSASRTPSKPGRRIGSWAGCTASRSAARSSANRCSIASPMRRRSRWWRWSIGSARAASAARHAVGDRAPRAVRRDRDSARRYCACSNPRSSALLAGFATGGGGGKGAERGSGRWVPSVNRVGSRGDGAIFASKRSPSPRRASGRCLPSPRKASPADTRGVLERLARRSAWLLRPRRRAADFSTWPVPSVMIQWRVRSCDVLRALVGNREI